METIEQAKQFVSDKLGEAKERRRTWESLLRSAEQAKDEAAEETAKTYEGADLKAYHKAQDAFRTAQDAIAMYSDKIEAIEAEPLITKEEYQECLNDIISILDNLNSDAKKRICAIVNEQIVPIADDIAGTISQANDLLVTLQLDLLKDHRAEKIPSLQNKYTDHSVNGFMRMIKTSNLYREGAEKNELP